MSRAEKIALVSMPGGGKSTIGRHLARRLNWDFVDTDNVIERRIGMPIREFFEREGEERFRDTEQEVIAELANSTRTVIAPGGGAILREATRRMLQTRSTVVYLRSTPEDIYRRLRHDTKRPLLQVADPLARLRELHLAREVFYREVAHFTIDTGRPSVPTLVNMILMQLELAGAVEASQAPSTIGASIQEP